MSMRWPGGLATRVRALGDRHGSVRIAVTMSILIAMLCLGSWQLAEGMRIALKASAAQWLIARAWDDNLARGQATTRPWEWADMRPLARLVFVRQQRASIVFDNDADRVLAFGPGLRAGSARPGQRGNTVISGHRDTHFSVLRDLAPGDPIDLHTIDGRRLSYRVSGAIVVDQSHTTVANDHGIEEITLVTCWPFDSVVPGGRLRLVVTADRVV